MNRTTFVGGMVRMLLVILSVIALTASLMAAPMHECVTVHVAAPFRLPDGLLYPGGVLTLCDSRDYSPVDNLHRILVGGSSVGLFVSSRRSAESSSIDVPQILFKHGADGNLELIGYTVVTSGRSVAYRMKQSPGMTWQAISHPPIGGATAAPVAAIVASVTAR